MVSRSRLRGCKCRMVDSFEYWKYTCKDFVMYDVAVGEEINAAGQIESIAPSGVCSCFSLCRGSVKECFRIKYRQRCYFWPWEIVGKLRGETSGNGERTALCQRAFQDHQIGLCI